jgi:predicted Zn-dependent protease
VNEDQLQAIESLAYTLTTRDRLDDAESLLRGVLAISPRRAYPHHVLGVIARKRRDPVAAADALRRCLEIDPGSRSARLLLSECLFEAGERDAAIQTIEPLAEQAGSSPIHDRARVLHRTWSKKGLPSPDMP